MPTTFNTDEVLEMAEQIERNGAKFYRKAANNASDKNIKTALLNMAAMEDGHLKVFEEMRKGLSGWEKEEIVFDPDNQSVKYLQAMGDARGYEGKITPTKELTGNETPKEIIEIALNSEKESVLFYLGLKGLVSERAGKEKVEAIILEELNHITVLLNELKALT
ncbi:MAG: ferritin family protein [Planctomycetota bacterium]|jgi:rubrerythrin